jgi:hypothetical protein
MEKLVHCAVRDQVSDWYCGARCEIISVVFRREHSVQKCYLRAISPLHEMVS